MLISDWFVCQDTVGDVTDEDIAQLEEQLLQQEGRSQLLDAELARLDAKLAVIDDEEEETEQSDLLGKFALVY